MSSPSDLWCCRLQAYPVTLLSAHEHTLYIWWFPPCISLLQKSQAGIRQNSLSQNSRSSLVRAVLCLTAVAFRVPRILHNNNSFLELTWRGIPAKTESYNCKLKHCWGNKDSQTWELGLCDEQRRHMWVRHGWVLQRQIHSYRGGYGHAAPPALCLLPTIADASWCVHVYVAYTMSVCIPSILRLFWYFNVLHLKQYDILVPWLLWGFVKLWLQLKS